MISSYLGWQKKTRKVYSFIFLHILHVQTVPFQFFIRVLESSSLSLKSGINFASTKAGGIFDYFYW